MKRLITKGYILITLALLIFISAVDVSRVHAQVNRIRNFRAVDSSDAELKVTVDYTYNGDFGSNNVYIHATPEESGGVFDPRTVDYEKVPLRRGTNNVTLKITKRPESRNFTSQSIRVCMSAPEEAILCEDFPYTKTWTTSTPVEDTEPPEIRFFVASPSKIHKGERITLEWQTSNTETAWIIPNRGDPEDWIGSGLVRRDDNTVPVSGQMQINPQTSKYYTLIARSRPHGEARETITVQVIEPQETCTISGVVSGRLQWDTHDDRGNPVSFTLKHIYISMMPPKSVQAMRRARIQGRKYRFSNVPAGQTYKISPGPFRSQPRERAVSCRPNATHRGVNFEITGPPPSG